MLAIRPEQVAAERFVSGETRPIGELLPRLQQDGVRGVTANGILGDATTASEDRGRTALRRAIADLVTFIAEWPTVAAPTR